MQEAVMLSGSLRHNLDLFGLRTDEQIEAAIQAVGLTQAVHDLGGLDSDLRDKAGYMINFTIIPASSSA